MHPCVTVVFCFSTCFINPECKTSHLPAPEKMKCSAERVYVLEGLSRDVQPWSRWKVAVSSEQGGTEPSTSRRSESAHVDSWDWRGPQPIRARTDDASLPQPSNGRDYLAVKSRLFRVGNFGKNKTVEGPGLEARGSGADSRCLFRALLKKKTYISCYVKLDNDLCDERMRMFWLVSSSVITSRNFSTPDFLGKTLLVFLLL